MRDGAGERWTHPRGDEKRYFAEGVVNAFFETQIALLIPARPTRPRCCCACSRRAAGKCRADHDVPAGSRRTVNSGTLGSLIPAPFSTLIESDEPVVADRTVAWSGGAGYGSHTETAVLAAGDDVVSRGGGDGRGLRPLLPDPELERIGCDGGR